MFSIFLNRAVCETVWENMVEKGGGGTNEYITGHMRTVCRITKA